MAFKRLEEFERERAEAAAAKAKAAADKLDARRAKEAKRALKEAVKGVLPKSLTAPKRKKGRTPDGGLSKREVRLLREQAKRFMTGTGGLAALEAEVQHTALTILLIDGVLGTEPWRASAGPHGGIVAANARVRYLENAARLLADIRRGKDEATPKLLEGVIDAEPVDALPPAPTPEPPDVE